MAVEKSRRSGKIYENAGTWPQKAGMLLKNKGFICRLTIAD